MAGPNANLPNGQEIVSLPLGNTFPWFSFRVGLSGVQYSFTARYNSRMNRWILDVADANETPIVVGIPLLTGANLLGRFAGLENIPIGTFFVTDDVNDNTQPGRYAFGITHTLSYLDPLAIT